MTTQAPASPVLQVAEYILSRLTTYFGDRPDHFSAFMDGNVRAEGWLPAEAFSALSGPSVSRAFRITHVRGKVQGEAKFNPDLELAIGEEVHQLAIVPALTSPDEPLSLLLDTRLREAFEWVGKLKARALLYLLAFPAGLAHPEWMTALAKAQEQYQAKAMGQMEFVIPRPPRPMLRASAALLLHASRLL
ncbi:MAG: hypothetical protein HY535_05575 [Chloroflexi bacterium]|nr:hypothetical protein [Chloroflexota bacterium]